MENPSTGISAVEEEVAEGEEGVTIRVFADMAFFFGVLLALISAADLMVDASLIPSAITGTTKLIPG